MPWLSYLRVTLGSEWEMENGLGGQGGVLLPIYYGSYLVTNVTAMLQVITNDNIT